MTFPIDGKKIKQKSSHHQPVMDSQYPLKMATAWTSHSLHQLRIRNRQGASSSTAVTLSSLFHWPRQHKVNPGRKIRISWEFMGATEVVTWGTFELIHFGVSRFWLCQRVASWLFLWAIHPNGSLVEMLWVVWISRSQGPENELPQNPMDGPFISMLLTQITMQYRMVGKLIAPWQAPHWIGKIVRE